MRTWTLICLSCLMIVTASRADELVSSKEGGFSIRFPEKPKIARKTVKTPMGQFTVEVLAFRSKKVTYAATFTRFPAPVLKDGDIKKRLNHARDGAVKRVKGKLLSESDVKLDAKYPGKMLNIVLPDERLIRARIYAVDRRLLETIVIGPERLARGKVADHFLNSLKLLD